jgi:hypothetical protein
LARTGDGFGLAGMLDMVAPCSSWE